MSATAGYIGYMCSVNCLIKRGFSFDFFSVQSTPDLDILEYWIGKCGAFETIRDTLCKKPTPYPLDQILWSGILSVAKTQYKEDMSLSDNGLKRERNFFRAADVAYNHVMTFYAFQAMPA